MTEECRNHARRSSRRGNSIVEVTLLMPWILFLFLAIFDFGFYGFALISVENAARSAAISASGSNLLNGNSEAACNAVLAEIKSLPNVGPLASCTCAGSSCTVGTPTVVTVTATALPAGPDGDPATEVAVTYSTINMFPLPWLPGKLTFTRTARMRM